MRDTSDRSEVSPVRVVVVGLGVQGRKRLRIAGSDAVATVDPVVPDAGHRRIEDVPDDGFDAALLCVPDGAKIDLISHLLERGKHVLVEKPLLGGGTADLDALAKRAREAGVVCYTAYNHRFEPHFVRMRDLIASGRLGCIHHVRMFYGNGTARDVRESVWRDQGAGVLPDLGSHLLDTVAFWLGRPKAPWTTVAAHRFENRAFDHVVLHSEGPPAIELEMSLLSWRNHFTADVFAEHGSAHIESLCKWGPTTFTRRTRVLPSGRPPEESVTLAQADPTWEIEYAHWKRLCGAREVASLEHDQWIERTLAELGAAVLAASPA